MQLVFQVARVGNPLRVGRPGKLGRRAEATPQASVDFDRLATGCVHVPETQMLVGEGNVFRVRRPARAIKERGVGAQIDHLGRLQTVLVADVELVLAGSIAEVGEGFPVRRPAGSRSAEPGVLVRLRVSPFSAGRVKMSPCASTTTRTPVGDRAKFCISRRQL